MLIKGDFLILYFFYVYFRHTTVMQFFSTHSFIRLYWGVLVDSHFIQCNIKVCMYVGGVLVHTLYSWSLFILTLYYSVHPVISISSSNWFPCPENMPLILWAFPCFLLWQNIPLLSSSFPAPVLRSTSSRNSGST